MADGQPETRVIGGYIWLSGVLPRADQPAYALNDVRRLGGDPERVRKEAPEYDGRTYTKASAD